MLKRCSEGHLELDRSVDARPLLDSALPLALPLPLPVSSSGLQQRASSSHTRFHRQGGGLLRRQEGAELTGWDTASLDTRTHSPWRASGRCRWPCMEQPELSWCSPPDRSPRLKRRSQISSALPTIPWGRRRQTDSPFPLKISFADIKSALRKRKGSGLNDSNPTRSRRVVAPEQAARRSYPRP